jgi:enterochelin esterase-like enzyme
LSLQRHGFSSFFRSSSVLALTCAFLGSTLSLAAPAGAEKRKAGPDQKLPWATAKASAPGTVYRTFVSKIVGTKVSYHVYLPDAYEKSKAPLPVLYWLHGTEGGISGIAPLTKTFQNAMASGRIPPMLVVFVNGLPRRLWADSKDGASPVETVFLSELIPQVDQEFRTIRGRKGRILEGFSMGGYGAARIGFQHSDIFSGISILAGGPLDLNFQGPRAQRNQALREQILRDVCSGDIKYFQTISPWMIAARSKLELLKNATLIRQVVGTKDDTLDLSRKFHQRLLELKIPHQYLELPSVGHDARLLLEALGAKNSDFYRRALGLSSASESQSSE